MPSPPRTFFVWGSLEDSWPAGESQGSAGLQLGALSPTPPPTHIPGPYVTHAWHLWGSDNPQATSAKYARTRTSGIYSPTLFSVFLLVYNFSHLRRQVLNCLLIATTYHSLNCLLEHLSFDIFLDYWHKFEINFTTLRMQLLVKITLLSSKPRYHFDPLKTFPVLIPKQCR